MAYPTKVTVVKYGPYFSSGSISFSQLRSNFTDDQPGFGSQISASQLRRNTDVRNENPIVPDSTENEQISTGSNLSLSQFRNSIKRYLAYQTGTDDNSSFPGEPGFRMGRLDSNNRGSDWSGGGLSGRDGQNGGTTGNLTKNVQKSIFITGTCGSVVPGQAGAQMAPIVRVHNVRIDVSGSILGYGGRGGGRGGPDPSGEDAGQALNFGNIGYNNRVIVGSGSRIWAGGGGGERGVQGANGANGLCRETTSTDGCDGAPGCPSGFYETGTRNGGGCAYVSYCCGFFCCGCVRPTRTIRIRDCARDTTLAGGIGGTGGRGGNGRGYNNQSGSLSGEGGVPGTPGNRSCGGSIVIEPQPGQNGGNGGNGGDWANDGQETPNTGTSGKRARAITYISDIGTRYDYYGSINSNTVKGEYT
jgi:hypothetical protein